MTRKCPHKHVQITDIISKTEVFCVQEKVHINIDKFNNSDANNCLRRRKVCVAQQNAGAWPALLSAAARCRQIDRARGENKQTNKHTHKRDRRWDCLRRYLERTRPPKWRARTATPSDIRHWIGYRSEWDTAWSLNQNSSQRRRNPQARPAHSLRQTNQNKNGAEIIV